MIILQGCVTKTIPSSWPGIVLPALPIAGIGVAQELETLCVPRVKCDHINEFLNEFYAFKVKYRIYQENLKPEAIAKWNAAKR